MSRIIFPLVVMFVIAATAVAGDPPDSGVTQIFDEPLFSQTPPDSPMSGRMGRGGPGGPGGPMPGMRQMRHLEQFRLLKLLELLDLKEDQEAQFISKYRQMRKEEREADQRERELVARLAETIKQGKSNDKTVTAMVDSILRVQEQSWRARQDRLQQFKGMLTVDQWARFIIFHERFEQEMLEQLRGFRERGMLERTLQDDRARQKTDSDEF